MAVERPEGSQLNLSFLNRDLDSTFKHRKVRSAILPSKVKSLASGPLVPIVTVVVMLVVYRLEKAAVVSRALFNDTIFIALLVFAALQIWWLRTKPKESVAE